MNNHTSDYRKQLYRLQWAMNAFIWQVEHLPYHLAFTRQKLHGNRVKFRTRGHHVHMEVLLSLQTYTHGGR